MCLWPLHPPEILAKGQCETWRSIKDVKVWSPAGWQRWSWQVEAQNKAMGVQGEHHVGKGSV